MPIRFAVTKASGQGEQMVTDICQWNPVTGEIVHQDLDEMLILLDKALSFSDFRMQDMNLRMIEAYSMREHFTPDNWQKVVGILDVLSGRQQASTVVQRWKDTLEENEALSQGRDLSLCNCHEQWREEPCPVHKDT